MALVPRFDERAARKGNLEPSTDNGGAEALASVAQASARIAGRLGQWADRRAADEGRQQALADYGSVDMPGVDYAFDGSAPATSVKGRAPGNAGELKSYLMNTYGLADFQASAAIGRFVQESSLRSTGAVGDNGTAFGLGQWRGARFSGLRAFASSKGKDWGDPFVQLDWFMHELGGSEASAGRAFHAATNIDEAAAAMMSYERPAGWTAANPRGGHGWANTVANAQRIAAIAAAAPNPAVAATGSTIDFARGAATDATVTASTPEAASGAVTVRLTGGLPALTLKPAGTLRADAYNRAAIDIFTSRADTAMRGQMEALALQHPDDPAALSGALDAMRAGYTDGLPAEARALLDQSFERQKVGVMAEAATRFRRNLEDQAQATIEENIGARMNAAFRLAANAGLDAGAEVALSGELGALEAQIDGSPLTPLQKSRLKTDAVNGVHGARILGGFEKAGGEAGRAAYLKKFQEDWKAGEGPVAQIDLATYDKVNGEMTRRVAGDQAAATRRAAAVDSGVKAQIGFLKKGWPVPDAARKALRDAASATGDPDVAKNVDFLDHLAEMQGAFVTQRPEAVQAQIDVLKAKIQKEGITEAASVTLDVLEGLHEEMAKGLATDPLGWADRAGVTRVEPLDFSDTGALSASLAERLTDAATVAAHYNVVPKYFTEAEAEALKKNIRTNPLALPSLASALSAGLGEATPAALAEISKDAPVLAQVAGIQHATGSQRIAQEVGTTLDLRNQPGYKAALPTDGKLQSAARDYLGAALGGDPAAATEVIDTAAVLLEGRALARGVPLDDFATAGSPSRLLFEAALDDALGATRRDGVKYGGLASVNGFDTVAPPDVAAEAMEGMLSRLSPDDMLFQRAVGTANGVPVSLAQIRQGRLVRVSNGRYRVATGDLEGGDPRYVTTPAGGYFELDISMLKRSQANRAADPLPVHRGNFR